ncbi:Uncharacterized protein APZ42_026452 [Daphnia magna]|uniref:Uncharacterized protein n=1 Tax=Daphnia magna TaxID=35525 RepID=A0A162EDB5_9CRUS|nr:Uncharacterized protein APZ42_026452 [Daphnia magna]
MVSWVFIHFVALPRGYMLKKRERDLSWATDIKSQRGRVPSANNSRNVKNFLRSCWVLVDLPAAKHLYNVLKTEDSFGEEVNKFIKFPLPCTVLI